LSKTSRSQIRRILTEKDKAILSRNFLISLHEMSGNVGEVIPLTNVYPAMDLDAYNLNLVVPVILDDYLIPNRLVEQENDAVRITTNGRRIAEKLSRPEVSIEEIMDIIELKDGETENITNIVKELIAESREIYRPRVFVNIVPNRKVNILDIILRNSGRSPAFNITCSFDPDLPYYNEVTLSNLSLFENLSLLEQNQEISFFYNSLQSVLEDDTFPKKTTVRIKYNDSKNRIYIENYIIDLIKYKGILVSDSADITDIHKDLENIIRQLDNIQRKGFKVSADTTKESTELSKKSRRK
jgi:hypothetical protein